jgi:hypothetical protein
MAGLTHIVLGQPQEQPRILRITNRPVIADSIPLGRFQCNEIITIVGRAALLSHCAPQLIPSELL